MIKVIAKSTAKPGNEKEIISVSKALVDASRKEDGCIQYELLQDPLNPLQFTMIETWLNMAAFNQHKTMPHVLEFVPMLNALRATKTVVEVNEVIY